MIQNSAQLVYKRFSRFDIVRNYECMKLKTIGELSNFNRTISITSNLWTTTKHDIGYICATAYYIDSEWQLCKKVIVFMLLKYLHTSITIYQTLDNIFYEYKINNSIFLITFW